MRVKGTFAIDAVHRQFPHLEKDDIAERLHGSTFVSVRNRYLYFEMPKAACSAIKDLVLHIEACPAISADAYIAGYETRRDMGIHVREYLPVQSLVELDDATQKAVLESPSYFRMLVVRNPYARLISAWRNKVLVCEPGFEYVYERVAGQVPAIENKSLIPFDAFIHFIAGEDLDACNPHWRRQAAHAFFPTMNFNFVGQTEKLDDALGALQRHLKSEVALKTKPMNVSGFQKDPAMTPEIADTIYNLYRVDFETFGYDRASWTGGRKTGSVSEDVFYDEVIERNLVIARLYSEMDRLKDQLGRAYPWSAARLWDGVRRLSRRTIRNG